MRWPSSVKSVMQDPKSLLVLENGVFVHLLYHHGRQIKCRKTVTDHGYVAGLWQSRHQILFSFLLSVPAGLPHSLVQVLFLLQQMIKRTPCSDFLNAHMQVLYL